MRINFNGQYREVAQLLRPPPVSSSTPTEFETTLGSLREATQDPTDSKFSEDSTHSIATAPPETALESGSAMARYSFADSTVDLPDLERLPNPESVKSVTAPPARPQVISAHWVTIERVANVDVLPEVKRLVDHYGKMHGVDPSLGLAVAAVESAFKSDAVSNDQHQSKGLFQLLDRTGQELHRNAGYSEPYTPFDPDQNSDLGLRYLRSLHDQFSTPTQLNNGQTTVPAANSASLEKLAVAAFNAGQGRVAAAQSQTLRNGGDPAQYGDVEKYLPQSTQDYVQKVLNTRTAFSTLYTQTQMTPPQPTVVLASTLHSSSSEEKEG